MQSFAQSVTCFFVFICLLSQSAQAQPGEPDDDDQLRTGLVGSYRDHAGHSFERVDSQVAFEWQQVPPDRRLSGGPYSVNWQGFLMSQAPGAYRLSLYAAGEVKVTLGDRVVIDSQRDTAGWLHSDPLDLPFDWHPLEISYTSPTKSGRINLFWSGPGFSLEPVSPRQLYHEPGDSPASQFERGEQLVRGLRCAACHDIPGEAEPMAAPSLVHVKESIEPAWMVDWLTAEADSSDSSAMRRMPLFALTDDQARAITAYLLAEAKPVQATATKIDKPKKFKQPEAKEGRRLVSSRGCLACHRVGELGRSGLFGGGELTSIGSKRPDDFFRQWLTQPASLNEDHRMPVYSLGYEELGHVAEYLQSLAGEKPASEFDAKSIDDEKLISRGKQLVASHQCGACHTLPADQPAGQGRGGDLAASSAWEKACSTDGTPADRPHYALNERDRESIAEFVSQVAVLTEPLPIRGHQLLVERNCLACHAREGRHGMAELLPAIGASDSKLNELLPALGPPTLTSVGDKLTDQALHAAIRREGEAHRPWLEVKMPKFRLDESQEQAIVDHLIATDRIPAGHGLEVAATAPESEQVLKLAGQRLVTSTGFGCTSCHAVGDVQPPKGPLDAKGPDLLMLGQRIRRPWYDRWVRNPARIVPRMEMPSVQLATPGVLHDNLDSQLAAVWEVLNLPDFRPPEPGPVRVVRQSGVPERKERAVVLTDVMRLDKQRFTKPLVVGLPNRHNMLFDLEQGRIAAWWIGDTAQQRTEGKTWYWTAGGENLLPTDEDREPEFLLVIDDQDHKPTRQGQFVTELLGWEHDALDRVTFRYRLAFELEENQTHWVEVRDQWQAIESEGDAKESGIRRKLTFTKLPPGASVKFGAKIIRMIFNRSTKGDTVIHWSEQVRQVIHLVRPDVAKLQGNKNQITIAVDYLTTLPVDRFPQELPPTIVPEPVKLASVPGFAATRLSLPTDVMPTAMAWSANGDLYLTSLKGRVWHGQQVEADDKRFAWSVFSDELAAPYGIATGADYVDVLNKYGLLRLTDKDADGFAESTRMLAAGWGHTDDYHDWAVGLERDKQGNYYVAIPCEQDGRSLAAARWRGKVLQIDPLRGKIEEISGGHRFPMGIARNRQGELFVTDNQGNYNPFNELNHVQPGRRYGFLNSSEKRRENFDPELTPPAIDIPHPWTRSVNGICFLETPEALREQGIENMFGPFEGHLVGCEYDTRRLIRLSLDHVGDQIQGAAYPLSIVPRSRHAETFLGPINCAVSPAGELLIGNIRDSGWGGGNNIGSLVSMQFDKDSLPAGIREVRAEPEGLRIDFTAALDAKRLANRENYAISSYTRVSTPAYGGDDKNRRRESVREIEVNSDRTSVLVKLDQLRAGYVYEIKLSGLMVGDAEFHPAEAYYTMRQVPD